MADSYAARLASLMLSPDNGAMVALAVEMAGRLDAIERDAMARRVVWASKKRTQRTRQNVPETSGDIGGQVETTGDIGGHCSSSPSLTLPTPTTQLLTTTTTATATTTADPATQDVPDEPSRSAKRGARATQRSSAVRQTWLSPAAEVWTNRIGAFPFGEAARALKPLLDAGLTPDQIAFRLASYLDELEDKGDTAFVSVARFAKTHLRYANGKPLTAADLDYAKLAAEAADVGRMTA